MIKRNQFSTLWGNTILGIAIVLCSANMLVAQDDSPYMKEVYAYQDSMNLAFGDADKSPLLPKDRKSFDSLDFFPITPALRVKAKFVRTPDSEPFDMKTSAGVTQRYEQYAELYFEVDGQQDTLAVYQSHRLRAMSKYRNYLFLPFKDATNGTTSYGGGRYISMWVPASDSVFIDFNKAYNPYCAYGGRYACPIVPVENHLPFAIPAGVMAWKKE